MFLDAICGDDEEGNQADLDDAEFDADTADDGAGDGAADCAYADERDAADKEVREQITAVVSVAVVGFSVCLCRLFCST